MKSLCTGLAEGKASCRLTALPQHPLTPSRDKDRALIVPAHRSWFCLVIQLD